MPPKADAWRDRPSAGQSGSTSAVFAFTTETPQPPQQTGPTHGATLQIESDPNSAVPQPGNQSPTTSVPTKDEDVKDAPTAAVVVADQIDQLENEVVHFMNLSLEEKEKSDVLSVRLASVTQEKEDIERQVDELDHELSQIEWQSQEGQDDGASATDTKDTISRVHAKITNLRTTAQRLESDLNTLAITGEQHTKTIAELEEQLRIAREQLTQKTQEEERLRKELEQATKTVRPEKQINEELRGKIQTLEHECNTLRISNAWTNKKLTEAEQTTDTLSDLVKRKASELEGVRKAGASQGGTMRQELDLKQKMIESLTATQSALEARCKEAESALRERPRVKHIPVQYQPSGAVEAARTQREKIKETRVKQPSHKHQNIEPSGTVEAAVSQREKEKDAWINKLTQELRGNQQRRVRAVAIGIDLSGSAAGSLTEGIKRLYRHLLGELRRSPCQTYVMTVVHGPGDTVAVNSNFGDTWSTHERVLVAQKADGMEQHVACLRKIKEVAVNTGLVLDLQVVLLGDSNTSPASHVGSEEVCHDFSCSNPTVHIHSVAVKTGSAEETEKYWNNMEAWQPWNYASSTGGNMMVWWQNSPLPDLSSLVY
ncbi:hypothetical protein INS49_011964 [Diaporthe citri]|uniref:uncharacterized protein n=1 Tax=Diaporthe citri TaxID=83186 RepID=UPI001C807271|nr:uncharacterized protein INS49_011964 [Diaporthe citri]KAG6360896.1 hypothetical protein INS49_011964 [Diaporthe citri]